jgi:hypothetical protein
MTSPLVPAMLLLISLARVSLADHHKKVGRAPVPLAARSRPIDPLVSRRCPGRELPDTLSVQPFGSEADASIPGRGEPDARWPRADGQARRVRGSGTVPVPFRGPGDRGRLEKELARLREAGVDADGEVGDPRPVHAIKDALREREVDEIIVSTLHRGSRWLVMDLPHRVRRGLELPVTHVAGHPGPAA